MHRHLTCTNKYVPLHHALKISFVSSTQTFHTHIPIIFLIHVLSWTDWSTRIHYWEFNIPSNSNITFDHNIPHLLATRDCNYAAGDFPSLANATTNVRNTAYHSKTPSESTFCVVCCLVPVLIMLHSLDLLWALDEANYVSTSVWGEVEQHHEAHQVPYLTPKKVALVFF